MTKIVYIYQNARGSITFSQESGFMLSSIDGLQTDVAFQSTQSAGQIGKTLIAQSIQPKSLTFNGTIKGTAIDSKREKLLSIAVPCILSTLSIIKDDVEWQLAGYISKTPLISDEVDPDFQFSFFAPYPYWQAKERRYELAGLTSRWRTPFYMTGTKKLSEFTTDMFKFIENTGDTNMCFSATIFATGKVVNPSIYNANLNTFIRINKTLQQGERFSISTHESDKDLGNAVLFFGMGSMPINGFKYIDIGSDLDMRINIGGNILFADAQEGKANMKCAILAAGGERHSL